MLGIFPQTRIKEILKRVKKNSKFYRSLLYNPNKKLISDDVSYEAFLEIPYTESHHLRNFTDAFMCVPPQRIVRMYLSSGTTGVYKKLFLTREDLEQIILGLKYCLSRAGLTAGTYFIPIFSYGHSGATEILLAADQLRGISLPVSIYEPSSVIALLKHIGCTIIFSLPSILLSIGHAYNEAKLSNVKSLIVGAELTTDTTRKSLTEFWKTDNIVEIYGSTDTGVLGFGYPKCHGVHLIDQSAFVELINPISRQPAHDYEVGEVIVTTFKEATPLIRYRVGDIAIKLPSDCSCGLNFPKIKILGRCDNIFIAGGALIFPIELQTICDTYYVQTGRKVSKLSIKLGRSTEEIDTLRIGVSTPSGDFDLSHFVIHFVNLLKTINPDFRNAVDQKCITVLPYSIEISQNQARKVSIEIQDVRSKVYLDKIQREKLTKKQTSHSW